MPGLRQVGAALCGLLLLQFSLLGSGTLCANRHAQHPQSHAGVGHEHSVMAPVAHVVAATLSSADDARPGCDSYGAGKSCQGPLALGGCGSMSTCVTTAMVPSPSGAAVAVHEQADALEEPSVAPSNPILGPELPPPRG